MLILLFIHTSPTHRMFPFLHECSSFRLDRYIRKNREHECSVLGNASARSVSPMWCIRIQEYKITGWGTHSMERFRSPDQPLPHSCTELRSTCAGPGILESASSIDRGWWTEMILFSCRQMADLRTPITEHPGSPQSLPIYLGATIMAFI